jgi:hypothetical protein
MWLDPPLAFHCYMYGTVMSARPCCRSSVLLGRAQVAYNTLIHSEETLKSYRLLLYIWKPNSSYKVPRGTVIICRLALPCLYQLLVANTKHVVCLRSLTLGSTSGIIERFNLASLSPPPPQE